MLKQLEEELLFLDSKALFVDSIVKGRLNISNKPKAQLLAELAKAKFPQKKLSKETEKEEEEKEGSGYDYLLSMNLWGLTMESVDRLKVLLLLTHPLLLISPSSPSPALSD